MLSVGQIILITFLAFLVPIDKYGMTFGLRWPVITALIVGLILGDVKTALYIGGTLQIMSLGVASIGGSSVPEYATAAIIATVIAVTTGQGMEAGLALGLPVAMLGVQFDVLAKISNAFIVKKSQVYANNKEFLKMNLILLVGMVFFGLTAAVPVFISITLGQSIIQSILNAMPAWFSQGLSIAGKTLPVVGISLLLNYMPVKKYFLYLLLGFFLAAYLHVPILGITIVGLIAALNYYGNNTKVEAAMPKGGLEDE